MDSLDLIRHLEKCEHALEWTENYLARTNEANAALHLADRVFFSPLTSEVHGALEGIRIALADIRG